MPKDVKLQELSESFASLDKNFKELRAAMPEDDIYHKCMDSMWNMISNVHDRIDRINQNSYADWENHMSKNSHLPKLTASQTEKLLKAAGAGEDFKVEKPILWARASRNNQVEVDLNIKS